MSGTRGRWQTEYTTYPDRVPMQNRPRPGVRYTVPEPIARLAYEEYCRHYGRDQSFERLHERGGFSVGELLMLLADLIERERMNR